MTVNVHEEKFGNYILRDAHHVSLERMYLQAPINQIYLPTIVVTETEATITIELSEKFHHAADAVHGSVYFKMLDDAAYFSASALERENFIFTLSFQLYLLRPVVSGKIRSVGRLSKRTRTHFFADAVLFDASNEEIAHGSGVFVRSHRSLKDAAGYRLEEIS